jgi:beta-glucuronidase
MRETSILDPRRLSSWLLARLALGALLAALALGAMPLSARAVDVPTPGALYRDGPSGRYLLGGSWQLRADPADQGQKAHWERSRSATGWLPTTVPNAANAGDYSEQSYLGGVDWYRKEFRAPEAPRGSRWILRFESVNYRATVWLNGRLIGKHTGAFLPFELGADDLSRTGVNRLVVRVDSRRGTFDVPSLGIRRDGRFVGGWWNYTGILREVYLRRVKRFDFRDVLVRPHLACRHCDATIGVTATVANLGKQDAVAAVEGRAARRDLHFKAAPVAGRGTRRFSAHLRLENPRLWSPEQPSLYKVRLLVRRDDGEVVQRYSVRIGIRHYSVSSAGKLLINYRPVTLHGASLHEDDPVVGAAVQPDAVRTNVALLRDLGATMTRSHYPLHPLTLELADRYGIVVWSEIPVYQMQDMLFRNARVRQQSLRMLSELIRRDRNHASVMVWSVGNENTSRPGPGFVRYVRQAKHLARRLDPTRLVGLAFPGYPTIGRQALYTELDVLGINDYFGWYPGPENSIARREDLGPYLDRLHSDYPKQALFITEFGAEANRSGPAEEKGTFEFQRDFLAYHLQVFAERPYINAALVWILRDFHVKPFYDGGNPTPDPPNNRKGLVDYAGTKKPGYETVRDLFGGPRGDQDAPGAEEQASRNSSGPPAF